MRQMLWAVLVAALVSCAFPMPINPTRTYHPTGWSPEQNAIITDALATLSARASVPFGTSPEGMPLAASVGGYLPAHDLLGQYDYQARRIDVLGSLDGRQLWLVVLHEVMHSVGVPHQPMIPPRLMSPWIDEANVGDVPNAQDLADLRAALRKPRLLNCVLFYPLR